MHSDDEEFAELVGKVRNGSEEAMLKLVEKYGQHVFRTVRRKLDRKLRSKFDSGDFVQAVWASFFENRDRLVQIPSAKDLVNYLSRMAYFKVTDERRRRLVLEGKNVNREVPLDRPDVSRELVCQAPTASEMAIADERMQQLTAGASARHQRIVEMRRAGATHVEIAGVLGVDPKMVQRVLRRLQRKVTS
jgi:RNA polymerase sigma factor (sigma-70 family)